MRRLAPLVLLLFAAPAPAQAAPQAWKASTLSPAAFADPAIPVAGRTVRAMATPSLGGRVLRLVVTNRHGATPLRVDRAAVATRVAAGSAATGPAVAVTFRGRRAVTVPAGRTVTSDPVAFRVRAHRDVAVDFAVAPGAPPPTVHPKAWVASYVHPGDRVGDPGGGAWQPIDDRPLLERLDVRAPRRTPVLVTFGESRTSGGGSTVDGQDRWPDRLSQRLGAHRSVVNAALGGNRLLMRRSPATGPAGLARLRRDVLQVPGVTGAVLLFGGNDLAIAPYDGQRAVRRGLATAVRRLQARGVRVTLGTVPPSAGFAIYTRPGYERQRTALNAWIRTRSPADHVVDFDRVLRDPRRPAQLRPALDSGDRIHPNPEGYGRMAAAVPVSAARPRTSSAAGAR